MKFGRCQIAGCKAPGMNWEYPRDGNPQALIAIFGWPEFGRYCVPHARKMIPKSMHDAAGVPAPEPAKRPRSNRRVAA